MRSRAAGIAVLASAVAVVGCGGSDHKSPPPGPATGASQLVDDIQARAGDGDAKGICDNDFSKALASLVERNTKKSCQLYVQQTLLKPYSKIAVTTILISFDGKRAMFRANDSS